MIGNNKLIINQATMREAIQYWLDREMHRKITVSQVHSNGTVEGTFTVQTTDREPDE